MTGHSPVLHALGWSQRTAELFDAHCAADPQHAGVPARVVRRDRGGWTVAGDWPGVTDPVPLLAELRGRLRSSMSMAEIPAVGDWVVVTPRLDEGRASIEAVLPRSSSLVREAAGPVTEAQVVAANHDMVLIVVPLDMPANPRRVERELAVVWESGATPVIVATKADLVDDPVRATQWIGEVALGVDVITVDAVRGDGVDRLDELLVPGSTIVLFGPSGAGKSTLANSLLGEDLLATGEVRGLDRRGRHTTTHRELVELPSGALLMDTPGIRELALWDAADGTASAFADVEAITSACRFNDCGHGGEPGCAVRAAIEDGSLAADRFDAWIGLQRELDFQARRVDAQAAKAERKRFAALTREAARRARR